MKRGYLSLFSYLLLLDQNMILGVLCLKGARYTVDNLV